MPARNIHITIAGTPSASQFKEGGAGLLLPLASKLLLKGPSDYLRTYLVILVGSCGHLSVGYLVAKIKAVVAFTLEITGFHSLLETSYKSSFPLRISTACTGLGVARYPVLYAGQ